MAETLFSITKIIFQGLEFYSQSNTIKNEIQHNIPGKNDNWSFSQAVDRCRVGFRSDFPAEMGETKISGFFKHQVRDSYQINAPRYGFKSLLLRNACSTD